MRGAVAPGLHPANYKRDCTPFKTMDPLYLQTCYKGMDQTDDRRLMKP